MLKGLEPDNPSYLPLSKQLSLLELKLKQANVNTDFCMVNMKCLFANTLSLSNALISPSDIPLVFYHRIGEMLG